MSKLSTYYGHSDYENRRAHVYALAHDNYAAQAWDGSTSFRLGEFETEEQAEMAIASHASCTNSSNTLSEMFLNLQTLEIIIF